MPKEQGQAKQTYEKLFWLFMVGSMLGVLLEGVFCLIANGAWESHVVTLFGQFNALYGVGAVLFYVMLSLLQKKSKFVQILAVAAASTALELICGIALADGLGMKAWDYSESFLNYRGMICLTFTLGWAAAAFVFSLLYDRIEHALAIFRGRKWEIACVALSVFMAVNLFATAGSIVRWSERHYGIAPPTKIGMVYDRMTPDEWMQKRFLDWSFLDMDS